MRRELFRKFLPESYFQDAYNKLQSFQQGDLSVEEYIERFDSLLVRCEVYEKEEQTIACYLQGLRKDIRDVVELQPYYSYHDMFKLAIKIETHLQDMALPSYFMGKSIVNKKEVGSRTAASNHAYGACSKSEKEGNAVGKGVQYFGCKGWGHKMQDCPNRCSLAVNGEAAEDDNSLPIFDEDPSEKGISISAEEGELLMSRYILNIAPILEDDWRHKCIFHTRRTVNGKVYMCCHH